MSSTDGPTAGERFLNGILPENPVYRSLLGMCPVLAVTAGMKPAMTMAGAVLFVLVMANIIISLIRNLLQAHLRILVFTLTIAAFVTIIDRFLAAFMYSMSKELGPYIPLIIVNCIIISRCEVCSSKQRVFTAIADAVGVSLGFALALASIATVRELLGSGTWFGLPILSALGWKGWAVMILPPGAFLALGVLLGGVNWYGQRKKTPSTEVAKG
ncbi:MAG: electron transport complex subunit RsxE [Deltaproteobacteria bacterium]|nr:electron transport complex subunit RsxE [Deltaproteobacteria bacterium]